MTQGTQRRLAAVVSADVVGYSRLMGRSERGTLAALKAHRVELIDPAIASHGGRTVKTTGDGLLLEFPSVVAAVNCCVAVQDGMARRNANVADAEAIRFRVGIHLGDVIADGDDIFGDGVNIAARLQEAAEPGSIVISAIVHNYLDEETAQDFVDRGERELKNIRRPVRIWQRPSGTAETPSEPLTLPDKPSIVVLPFTNMSGDPEQEYFSDGITEDIITALSRFRGLFVIARNSSFAYKSHAVNVRDIGRELGVSYILEGSVRRLRDRIRVTAQLVDAESGRHHWAERYDRQAEDIFAVQDELTETIAATLEGRLGAAAQERAESKHPGNLNAYDYVLRGQTIISRDPESNRCARNMYIRATELDPRCARAWSGIAMSHLLDWTGRWGDSFDTALDEALAASRKAVAIDTFDGHSHRIHGAVLLQLGDHDAALDHIELALRQNPNDANSHCSLGYLLSFVREPGRALEAIKTAIRLNPHHPSWYLWYQAFAQIVANEYEFAAASLRSALARYPDFVTPHRHLAVCYIRLGREDDARKEATEILRLDPGYGLAALAERLPFKYPDDSQRYLDDLRKAGLPEK